MKVAESVRDLDVRCPYCETWLTVEDPDDFDKEVERGCDERHLMKCAACGEMMWVPVSWEPYYGEPEKMEE